MDGSSDTASKKCSDEKTDHYCLKWSNYPAHVVEVLMHLLKTQSLVDVTLCAAGGEKVFAHRVILCAYSSYFTDILSQIDDPHPVIILSEMSAQDVKCVLEFLYSGELNVDAQRVSAVLSIAESLQIRTLMEVSSHLHDLSSSHDEMSINETQTSSLQEASSLGPTPSNTVMTPIEVEVGLAVEISDSFQHAPLQAISDKHSAVSLDENDLIHMHLQEATIEHYHSQACSDNVQLKSHCLDKVETIQDGNTFINEQLVEAEDDIVVSNAIDHLEKKRRKRQEGCRKEYSEEQLNNALADLRAGRYLGETALAHRIPRSTLYVRAKAAGVPITVTRQEHSEERVRAAVDAVVGGASLQQASALYQIPKTVLWRRVQAAGGRQHNRQRQMYSLARRQAAVEALQNGQNLSKVSDQFQIPKTTLFREKARLVESGKLPWSSVRRKGPSVSIGKQSRLSEAVAACQEGKMSQAIASATFQIPKTTIWRRLKKKQRSCSSGNEDPISAVSQLQEQPSFAFCEGNNQIPIAYIVDGTDFTGTPIII